MNTLASRSLSQALSLSLVCGALLLSSAPARADVPQAAMVWFECKPVESMIYFGSRYHIKCDAPLLVGNYRDVPIFYFAIADSNATQVQQAMALTNAAITSGKRLTIHAFTGATNNPAGCLTSDCRSFDAVVLVGP